MKLLHIDSSALGANSVTRELSAAIVARWQAEVPGLSVEYRDLDANPVAAPDRRLAGRHRSRPKPPKPTRLLQQFLDADVIVVGAPMYNFGIPSTLKAWIDRITVAGKTFRYTDKGPEGLAGGKRVIVASGRGGLHTGAAQRFPGTLPALPVRFPRHHRHRVRPRRRRRHVAAAPQRCAGGRACGDRRTLARGGADRSAGLPTCGSGLSAGDLRQRTHRALRHLLPHGARRTQAMRSAPPM